jgi:hypothetical protein
MRGTVRRLIRADQRDAGAVGGEVPRRGRPHQALAHHEILGIFA